MAQLYKMTLYVCDLEGDLSLDDIKRAIRYDAFDGIAINCVTHFSGEKIGPKIDWDDDIELNNLDCPDFEWEKYFSE